MSWIWPIPSASKNLPGPETQGYFGAIRKNDVHTGIDIYCEPDALVVAVESGVVINIEKFTGASVGSPWWEETDAVWVKGSSGVVVYGEVSSRVSIGQQVNGGDTLGSVKTVLKKDKGLPMTMLHIELYRPSITETVWWKHGEDRPEELLDPTSFLENIK